MKNGVLFLAMGLILVACAKSDAPPSRDELAAFAQTESLKLIKAKMRDPDSAKFEDVRISWKSGQPITCGRVNSTNGFGGKTGYQRFLSNGVNVTVLEEEVEEGGFDTVAARFC